MAGKLENRLQPGERVVFGTRAGGRPVLRFLLVAPAATAVAWWGIYWGFGIASLRVGLFYGVIAAIIDLLSSGLGAEALVTERRLLIKAGFPWPRVTEIPLAQIAGIELVDDQVVVRDRGGGTRPVSSILDRAGLAGAIAARTGAAAPALPPQRLDDWAKTVRFLEMAGGFSAVIWLASHFERAIDMGRALGEFRDLLHPAALLAVIFVGMFLGSTIGMALLAPAMRLSLSARDARRVFEWEERRRTGNRVVDLFLGLPRRIARRLASFLYGERI